MASSRFGPGGSSAGLERPIFTGYPDKETWVTELQHYVTTMKERYPDADHPPIEWLTARVSMILLDQGQSATVTPMQGGLAAIRDVVRDEVTQPITDMQRRLDEHTRRHTVNELNSRQFQLTQREKDRCFHVGAFSIKATQYHAGDLFDIQSVTLDIAEHAKVLAPNLALNFGQPLSNASGAG